MINKIALGIHIGHDRGVAVVKDGLIIGQLAEERIDRIKHSNSPELPKLAINRLLRSLNIKTSEISSLGISYTNVIIENVIADLQDEVRDFLGRNDLPIYGVKHHESHAYSTYFTSPFNESVVLVADGAGDIVDGRIEAESIYYANKQDIILKDFRLQDFGLTRTNRRNTYSPKYIHKLDTEKEISLGRKYEQFTYLIGFQHGQAGKTMGLSSYSEPLFKVTIPNFTGLEFSLSFMKYLDEIEKFQKKSGLPWHIFLKQNAAPIASLAQSVIEGYFLKILENTFDQFNCPNLSLAGGVFLNCLLNHKILHKTKFSNVHIVPAAGDDGQCIGAAFYAYKKMFENLTPQGLRTPYLGIRYNNQEIEERLRYFNLQYTVIPDKALAQKIAFYISEGKNVGLFRGKSEMGPRALCHRSIIADPRSGDKKDELNLLKGRELFRPFAPVTTVEDQFDFFDLKQSSPYMLLATTVKEKWRERLAAITHVDGTSRVQSVSLESEGFVYTLLKEFEKITGFPILLNTSFNLAGEPIVESPHDAISTFLSSNLDALVLENYLIHCPSK